MKIKAKRLDAIVKLIENHKVGSQEELLLLLDRENYKTTQATLSRDLKLLKVAKQPDNEGGYIYVINENRGLPEEVTVVHEDFPLSGIISLEFSTNLAVMKTRPGFANGIASVIDSHGAFEILGTVAGDDTILLIAREGVSREEFLNALAIIVPGIGNRVNL